VSAAAGAWGTAATAVDAGLPAWAAAPAGAVTAGFVMGAAGAIGCAGGVAIADVGAGGVAGCATGLVVDGTGATGAEGEGVTGRGICAKATAGAAATSQTEKKDSSVAFFIERLLSRGGGMVEGRAERGHDIPEGRAPETELRKRTGPPQ